MPVLSSYTSCKMLPEWPDGDKVVRRSSSAGLGGLMQSAAETGFVLSLYLAERFAPLSFVVPYGVTIFLEVHRYAAYA